MGKFYPYSGFLSVIITLVIFAATAFNSSNKDKIDPDIDFDSNQLEMFDPGKSLTTGKQLYNDACANCHGINGKGASMKQLGLQTPPPDFTDCSFASREPDGDWIAVAHQGGPTRGFSTEMPAFGDALSTEELQKIMDHIRTFCTNDNWPRGELNLPRPLVTEKAYPEDEVVLSTSVDMENEGSIQSEFIYERRFGARNQIEVVLPFAYIQQPGGNWSGGHLGDVAVGIKRALYHSIDSGTIFSFTGEVILPSGDERSGAGKGTTVLEPFTTFGQILPMNGFLQLQAGMEYPLIQEKASNEAFWRVALGKSYNPDPWGRTWSPMVEILGSRELESNAVNQWDLVPQMQITLNVRQHIMLNIGYRIPVEDAGRDSQLMVYILWDWFDGGPFEGW